MTQPSRSRTPRRSNADYRWTKPRIMAFLHKLAASGSVAAAAREVGMSRQSAYRLRARLGEEFAAIWDEGLRVGAALRRSGLPVPGMQGDTRPAQGDTHPAQGDTSAAR